MCSKPQQDLELSPAVIMPPSIPIARLSTARPRSADIAATSINLQEALITIQPHNASSLHDEVSQMTSHVPKTADCKHAPAPSTTGDQLLINNNADGYTETIIHFQTPKMIQ